MHFPFWTCTFLSKASSSETSKKLRLRWDEKNSAIKNFPTLADFIFEL